MSDLYVCPCACVVLQEDGVPSSEALQTSALDSAVASLARWSAPQWSRPAEPIRTAQQPPSDVTSRSDDVTGPSAAPTQSVFKQTSASESVQRISQQFQQQQQERQPSPPRQVRKETKTTTESVSKEVRKSVNTTESAVKIGDAPAPSPQKTFYQATTSTKASRNENGLARSQVSEKTSEGISRTALRQSSLMNNANTQPSSQTSSKITSQMTSQMSSQMNSRMTSQTTTQMSSQMNSLESSQKTLQESSKSEFQRSQHLSQKTETRQSSQEIQKSEQSSHQTTGSSQHQSSVDGIAPSTSHPPSTGRGRPPVRPSPPPIPSKFIRGEMRESDYESDMEGGIPARWQPSPERARGTGQPGYRRVEYRAGSSGGSVERTQGVPKVRSRSPTPPSKFETPAAPGEVQKKTVGGQDGTVPDKIGKIKQTRMMTSEEMSRRTTTERRETTTATRVCLDESLPLCCRKCMCYLSIKWLIRR